MSKVKLINDKNGDLRIKHVKKEIQYISDKFKNKTDMEKTIELTKVDDNKWKVSFYTTYENLEHVVKSLKESDKEQEPKKLIFDDWVKKNGYRHIAGDIYQTVTVPIVPRSASSLGKEYLKYWNND